MLPVIRDLYAHQAWADAEMWRYAEPYTPEKRILELLNHIHAVQRYFLSVAEGEALTREELMVELPAGGLKQSYRRYHERVGSYLPKVRESHLNDLVNVPWFPTVQPHVGEALMQSALHSIHHRAQVVMLAHERGAETGPVDYIVWVTKSRPAPAWDFATSAT